MHAIYKYQLPVKEKHVISLPQGATILRVDSVEGLFFLWAAVCTDEHHPTTNRYLEFYKTGQPISTPLEDLNFLGTCKMFIMQELCLYVFENITPICTETHPSE